MHCLTSLWIRPLWLLLCLCCPLQSSCPTWLWLSSAVSWPLLLRSNYSHCIYSSQMSHYNSHFKFLPADRNDHRTLQGCQGSLYKSSWSNWWMVCLWTPQIGGVGFKWPTSSNIMISISLGKPSYILNQCESGISNSFSIGRLLVYVSTN